MREGVGLYRGKRLDNGEWVEGNLLTSKDGAPDRDFAEILVKDKHGYGVMWHEVDMETICQWTGLVDANGTKIFEGDIVRHYNKIDVGKPDDYDTGEIRWNKNSCRFERTSSESITGYETVFIGSDCVYEVISSIHDKAVEE